MKEKAEVVRNREKRKKERVEGKEERRKEGKKERKKERKRKKRKKRKKVFPVQIACIKNRREKEISQNGSLVISLVF